MTLIKTADRLNTANQLKTWNEQAINSMNSAKGYFSSILNQKDAMINNTDYTEDDINEVNAILEELQKLALELTE